MRNVSDKSCEENQNTHLMFGNFFLKLVLFYEIMWKNNVDLDRPQLTVKGRAQNDVIYMPDNKGNNRGTCL
jgi:hypothetical protein